MGFFLVRTWRDGPNLRSGMAGYPRRGKGELEDMVNDIYGLGSSY